MNKLFDMNVLYDAFKVSMNGSAWKEEPQRFEIDFLSELISLKKELEEKTYKTGQGSVFIHHERGKSRLIHGSRMRDRVVRHALCDNEMLPKLEKYLIHNNAASQKGKGISFARKAFEQDLHSYWREYGTNEGYIGFVDFSKFYDNIQHDKIMESICPKISEEAAWLLGEILKTFEVDVSYMTDEEFNHCMEIKYNSIEYHKNVSEKQKTGEKIMRKSVEIGDQVSQVIGIYYPTPVDNYVKIVRGCKRYGRYMDDIYIISQTKEEVSDIIKGIKKISKELGLFVNDKKTRIVKLSDRYTYLKIRYSLTETGRVIRKIYAKNITRERRKLKSYKRLMSNNEMEYNDVEGSFMSWLGCTYPYMSKIQITNMLKLYYDLYGKLPQWTKHSTLRYLTTQLLSDAKSQN